MSPMRSSSDSSPSPKFLMYMDLDPSSYPNWDEIVDRPLLKALFSIEIDDDSEEVDIDSIPYRDLYHVVDADSSQIGGHRGREGR